ncbi:arsenic resistance N-acetyltransferase ArsN2 [Pseudoxanthomonas sp. z9]|uniref:arsenic resistance N-acetyltransferase ArsN2 n=1 Tax=Pseudoxanthomonas sp. z9 TaxID=2584942 RepID=UPI00114460E1|nr:arsenic resistance N-acetyltransferase ArsN2 [Pseudoxanthomonas sp. z9]
MPSIQAIDLDAAVTHLLSDSGLPTADLANGARVEFLGARRNDVLEGCVALERCGELALLRSLAVSRQSRGSGLGTRLVARVEDFARQRGYRAIYLLTTNASDFFAARGYQPVDREQAPASVRATSQFSALCPASSLLMFKPLANE